MKKLIYLLMVSMAFLGSARPALGNAISIGFNPTAQGIIQGSSADIVPQISGLGAFMASSLGVYDLVVGFDPTILAFSGAVFGDPMWGDQLNVDGLGVISTVTPGLGNVELFELSLNLPSDLDSLQAPSFTLATLTFQGIGVGTSTLDITILALGDSYGNSLAASVSSAAITVNPSAVPEPTTLALLCSGVLSLSVRRLRRPPSSLSRLRRPQFRNQQRWRCFVRESCRCRSEGTGVPLNSSVS